MEQTDRRTSAALSGARWFLYLLLAASVLIDPPPGLERTAFVVILVLGLVPGALVPLLARVAPGSRWGEHARVVPTLALLALEAAFVAGVTWATGGVVEPYWVAFVLAAMMGGYQLPPVSAAGYAAALAALVPAVTALAGVPLGAVAGPLVFAVGTILASAAFSGAIAYRSDAYRRQRLEQIRALEEQAQAIETAFAAVAAGDLSGTAVLEVAATTVESSPLAGFGRTFADMLTSLRALVSQVQVGGEHLSDAAQRLAATAEEEAAVSGEQSSAVAETTSTIQELAATAASIAQTAASVASLAEQASTAALRGSQAVHEFQDGMERISLRVSNIAERTLRLGQLSQEIGAILELSRELSDQTNLLALNAAIEAARAGEHGRGFAVVAGEVRNLAPRAQVATRQIQDLVGEIREETSASIVATEEGSREVESDVALADEAADALGEITQLAGETSHASNEISVATAQQRAASEQVVVAMGSVAHTAQQFADASRSAVSSATGLNRQAQELRRSLARFRVGEQ